MLEAQDNACRICGKRPDPNRKSSRQFLSVDHDHINGRVRGLVCQACNLGLGGFQDNVEILERAIAYVREFRS